MYRGKSNYNKEWAYGSTFSLDYLLPAKPPTVYKRTYIQKHGTIADKENKDRILNTLTETEVYEETVGQYVGIEDKNGVKIFEGDIVKAVINGGNYDKFEFPLAVVVFENCSFALKDKKETTPICSFAPSVSFEVIGNIYDNPELMEDKQC